MTSVSRARVKCQLGESGTLTLADAPTRSSTSSARACVGESLLRRIVTRDGAIERSRRALPSAKLRPTPKAIRALVVRVPVEPLTCDESDRHVPKQHEEQQRFDAQIDPPFDVDHGDGARNADPCANGKAEPNRDGVRIRNCDGGLHRVRRRDGSGLGGSGRRNRVGRRRRELSSFAASGAPETTSPSAIGTSMDG